jgi:hypothetical protein
MTGNNPTTDSGKQGTKRHNLTYEKRILLSVVISPTSTHDIKLVTDIVDSVLSNELRPNPIIGKRRQQQHLSLDKG